MRIARPLAAASFATLLACAGAACAQTDAEVKHGGQVFAGQCALCHGANGAGGQGPPLQDVVGRKVASTGFAYTPALKARGAATWDARSLSRYLADPRAAVPGTAMAVQVSDAKDRHDLIAYLATLKAKGAPAAPAPVAANGGPFGGWREDAPGKLHHITVADLPRPYATRSSSNGSQQVPRPAGALPRVPPGFKVAVFADGLEGPRQMRVMANGDVFVAETAAGRIRVLRAKDGAEHPDTTAVFTSGLTGPFGMAAYPAADPRWLYVAERNRVVRFPYRTGDLKARGEPEVVVAQLAPTTGGHTTRDLVFSPDGARMFVSVGSASNVAEEMPKKTPADAAAYDHEHGLGAGWGPEENRADVLVFTPEGKAGKVFAAGIRNCVGLAVQPKTGALWCSVNERDELGDNLVPDYLTRVKEGGFYGWPWLYLGDHEDPRLKGERPDLKGRATAPDLLLQAHSASLGMTFYTGSAMPPAWRGSAFAAEHGSWNRGERTGPKLIRIPLNPDGTATGAYEDVMTGFTVDNQSVWGRPVGVAAAHDGAILVSDDGGGVVWRLTWSGR